MHKLEDLVQAGKASAMDERNFPENPLNSHEPEPKSEPEPESKSEPEPEPKSDPDSEP